jgi:hypothetical protein
MSPKKRDVIGDAVADIDREALGKAVNKDQRIEIRATGAEKVEIQKVAESLDLSVAEYLLALHRHAYPKLNGRR